VYKYIIRFADGSRRVGVTESMACFTAELWNLEWEKRKYGIKVKSIDVWRRKR
jgi:hypothetical protein